jgi:very-short-patch-repair endonuclease
MILNKDLIAAGLAISRGIKRNKKDLERRRKHIKTVGKPWKRYTTFTVTKTEKIILESFPEAVHNFRVLTSKSAKWDRVASHYTIDAAWPDIKLAVELDGLYHQTPEQLKKDRVRDKFLNEKGWTVLRFLNHQVIRDLTTVTGAIKSSILKLRATPVT